jgi:hypothetical protein
VLGDALGKPAGFTAVIYSYVADVQLDSGGPVFRTQLEEPQLMAMFKSPPVGATVRVKANAKKQEARFDHSDPTLSMKTQEKDERTQDIAKLESALQGAPGGSDSDLREVQKTSSALSHVDELKSLHERGILSDAEYSAKMAEAEQNFLSD